MAKTRMVKTIVWEDEWFFELSTDAQRAYLYLITNKNTEISGIYRLPKLEMMMYLKIKETKKMDQILNELMPKIIYHDGWVIIPKYPEHQNVTNNVKVQTSIEKYLETVPDHILNIKSEIINHKSEAIDNLSIAYTKSDEKLSKTKENKASYGELGKVKLTQEEHAKLVEKLGKHVDNLIEELDTYIGSSGKRYSSHYATLLNWSRRKGIDSSNQKKSKYDI